MLRPTKNKHEKYTQLSTLLIIYVLCFINLLKSSFFLSIPVNISSQLIFFDSVHQTALSCFNQSFLHVVPVLKNSTFEERKNVQLKIDKFALKMWDSDIKSIPWGLTGKFNLVDEYFRDFFQNKSIYHFGPFVPLIFPFVKFCQIPPATREYFENLNNLFSLTDPNLLTVTVCWSDFGISCHQSPIPDQIRTSHIFRIGPSEFYNLIIPFLGKPHSSIQMLKPKYFFFFSGRLSSNRQKFNQTLHYYFGKKVSINGYVHDYLMMLRFIMIGLSPFGKVRSCYRTTEYFQLGIVPWIIQKTLLKRVIPYEESMVLTEKILFFSKLKDGWKYQPVFNNFSVQKAQKMRKIILRYQHSHFNVEGVMHQIQRFLLSGFEDSDLRCGNGL